MARSLINIFNGIAKGLTAFNAHVPHATHQLECDEVSILTNIYPSTTMTGKHFISQCMRVSVKIGTEVKLKYDAWCKARGAWPVCMEGSQTIAMYYMTCS